MSIYKRLSDLFKKSDSINIDESSKFFITSDCHRGDGSWKDDFAHNQNVYYHALRYYYSKGFSYAELGDGDEMWQTRDFEDIKRAYSNIFTLLADYNNDNRLLMIWGNHDNFKKHEKVYRKYFKSYYHEPSREFRSLMPKIVFRESIILNYKGNIIFMLHGHQADLFNDKFSFFSKMLAGHLWARFQAFGMKDPIGPVKSAEERNRIENRLMDWASKESVMLIAGHTHRAMFTKPGSNTLYFNTGSCVHPRCITGIEIDAGHISLVKWHIGVRENGDLYINRQLLEKSENLDDYFKAKQTVV